MLPIALSALALATASDHVSAPKSFVPRPLSDWCTCTGPHCGPRAAREDYGMLTGGNPTNWIPRGVGFEWVFMPAETKRHFYEERYASAVPWTGKPWEPVFVYPDDEEEDEEYDGHDGDNDPYWKPSELTFKAETYPTFDLFPELKRLPSRLKSRRDPTLMALRGKLKNSEEYVARSPSGKWAYVKRPLKKGYILPIHQWERYENETAEGNVMFDGPIEIPIVLEGETLWMSHTPQEIFSQIGALKQAKGKVIIAGLGLGWSVTQAANNPNITEVVIIERSQELVDWILPRLCPLIPDGKKVTVIIGDVHEVVAERKDVTMPLEEALKRMPRGRMRPESRDSFQAWIREQAGGRDTVTLNVPALTGDYILIDIWPTYTDIEDEMDEMMKSNKGPGVREWWGWGNDWDPADIQSSHYWWGLEG